MDWIDWTDETCDPHCELPHLTDAQPSLGDVEACAICGRLWRLQAVTEMQCEEINGEPIPGTFTPLRTVDAWVPTR